MYCAGREPIIQIHPTRRCNLRCLHCYSGSSPEERDFLSPAFLTQLLEDAWAEGYRVASFSGGEPILYPHLKDALRAAKELGMRTTITSNGMLLTEARLASLSAWVDVLAISLDGVPESHNRMRACNYAFERMHASLEAVRKSGIDFGFIFTLTLHNVNEVDWAAGYAVEQGAKLFQIHPLEEVGRAAAELPGQRPDALESTYAFLEAERLRRKYANRLLVQLDIVHRDLLMQAPERFYAAEPAARPERLAECVTPLVVEADGNVVPLGYGFGREFAVGCIVDRRLRDLAPEWIRTGYVRFLELCRRVYAEASQPAELPFLNWYELIGSRSGAQAAPVELPGQAAMRIARGAPAS
jgi:MoaA/NifB/PqqE/SkfB family radical SAM enzyme